LEQYDSFEKESKMTYYTDNKLIIALDFLSIKDYNNKYKLW